LSNIKKKLVNLIKMFLCWQTHPLLLKIFNQMTNLLLKKTQKDYKNKINLPYLIELEWAQP
jgi:hypothetical protein